MAEQNLPTIEEVFAWMRKLYDESYISVTAELVGDATAGEDTRFDLVYRLSYNCKHIEGYTDDYPLGAYDVDSSNSCRAICNLTKHFLENDLRHLITPGKEVEITISSSADGTEFTTSVPYFGQYGDFRYCPVTFNGERLRVSVDRTTGINNNCQAVRAWMEENIPVLRQTANNFNFVAQSYKDSTHVHYYRRSSVEIRVLDVEREVFERSIADKRMDEYVDYNIRQTNIKNSDAYVLIIANEDYAGALMPKVSYAANDGDVLQRYFVRSLGVPERQVKVLHNASKEEILNEGIHWLTDLSQAVAVKNGDQAAPLANLFIYYAGLGFTDLNGAAYLVPNNVKTDDIKSLNPQNGGGCKLFGGKKNKTHDTVNYDVILSKKDCSRLTPRLLSVEELCGAFKNYPVKNLTPPSTATTATASPTSASSAKSTPRKRNAKPTCAATPWCSLPPNTTRPPSPSTTSSTASSPTSSSRKSRASRTTSSASPTKTSTKASSASSTRNPPSRTAGRKSPVSPVANTRIPGNT